MSAAGYGPPASAQPLGLPRLHLRVAGSTNEQARELAQAGASHGTLVTASEQTAGRGRQGRRWSAPPGSSILMSLLLRDPPALLPLIAAVAVCELAGAEALIKWPNDIVVPLASAEPGRPARLAKLAGILAEGRPQEGWVVLGIGVNVAVRLEDLPPELRRPPQPEDDRGGETPAAMPAATMGRDPAELEGTLARLLELLQSRLGDPSETILERWRSRDALLGREIGWAQGRGRAAGIDGEGRLIVALSGGGQTTLSAGEVHLDPLG
jgi:BirA family transcriptional regulator, biotin operon repressor / biotin---[acetyl-CoA-carboxylase] ligase